MWRYLGYSFSKETYYFPDCSDVLHILHLSVGYLKNWIDYKLFCLLAWWQRYIKVSCVIFLTRRVSKIWLTNLFAQYSKHPLDKSAIWRSEHCIAFRTVHVPVQSLALFKIIKPHLWKYSRYQRLHAHTKTVLISNTYTVVPIVGSTILLWCKICLTCKNQILCIIMWN